MNDKNEPRIDADGKKHYTLKAETGHVGTKLPELNFPWESHIAQFHVIAQFAQSQGRPPTFAIEAVMNIDAAITELENQNAQLREILKAGGE